jgi:hypothetical protein
MAYWTNSLDFWEMSDTLKNGLDQFRSRLKPGLQRTRQRVPEPATGIVAAAIPWINDGDSNAGLF